MSLAAAIQAEEEYRWGKNCQSLPSHACHSHDAPLAGIEKTLEFSTDGDGFLQETINELKDITAVNVDRFHKLMRVGSVAKDVFGESVSNLTDEQFYARLDGFYAEIVWQEEEDNKSEIDVGSDYFEHHRLEDDAIQKVVSGETDVVLTDGELEFGVWFISDAAIKDEQRASEFFSSYYPTLVVHPIRLIRRTSFLKCNK